MNVPFATALYSHYDQVHHRLCRQKLPWVTPSVELLRQTRAWTTPSIECVGIRIAGVPACVEDVMFQIHKEHGVSWKAIIGSCKVKRLVIARQHLYYLLMTSTKLSSIHIGNYVRRYHSTVLYGAVRHAQRHHLELPRDTRFNVRIFTNNWPKRGLTVRFEETE